MELQPGIAGASLEVLPTVVAAVCQALGEAVTQEAGGSQNDRVGLCLSRGGRPETKLGAADAAKPVERDDQGFDIAAGVAQGGLLDAEVRGDGVSRDERQREETPLSAAEPRSRSQGLQERAELLLAAQRSAEASKGPPGSISRL